MNTETVCYLEEALDDAEAKGYGKVRGEGLLAIRVVRAEEARKLKHTVLVEDTGTERRISLLDPATSKPGTMIMKLRKFDRPKA